MISTRKLIEVHHISAYYYWFREMVRVEDHFFSLDRKERINKERKIF
jgi:hypothetical protein